MTIYCNQCNLPNPAGAERCASCGHILSQNAETRPVVIGSGAQSDLKVLHPEVSSRHFRLTPKSGGGYVLEDLGSTNGTFLNGQPVRNPTEVQWGDSITLGPKVGFSWKVLEETHTQKNQAAPSSKELLVGADTSNDIVLDMPAISGRHAKLTLTEGGLLVEDLGSTNGTFLNSRNNPISRAHAKPGDILYFASYRVPVDQLLKNRMDQTTDSIIPFVNDQMIIGRDSVVEVVLSNPLISRRHARILRRGGHFIVEDLDSSNGTFVNGHRVSQPQQAALGDEIGVGPYLLTLCPNGVILRDMQGKFTLEARDVTLQVGKGKARKTLLDAISLSVMPGEFCGLMAPSGAGKTTLLKTALGYYKPTSGQVLVNGRDLHGEYDAFRTSIGYVPQEDILHADLTVGQALTYSARLRLEEDLDGQAVTSLVDGVIERLGLFQANKGIRDTKIANISGGQRRRVNMAIEMLVNPSIFFLDEPTSGLSSEDALVVMKILRDLADEGKIIILTLHQPSLEIYKLMDHLIFLHLGGKLVYFGPAMPDSLTYTNPELPEHEAVANPDLALRGIGSKPPDYWQKTYQSSPYFQDYVQGRKGSGAVRDSGESGKPKRSASSFRQWWILHCRNFRVKLQDRMNTAILLAQAPVIALLIAFALLPKEGESGFQSAPTALFLMNLTAIWFGCSNAARDICGDWHIYQRERMYNLKITAFVGSKLSVGAMICVIQCLILTPIVSHYCKLKAPLWPVFSIVLTTALAGMSIGLFISAFASPFKKRNEIAIGLTPLVLIPMVVLGGMVKPIKDMAAPVEVVSKVMVSRWAFEATLQMEAEQRTEKTPTPEGVEIAQKDVMIERFFDKGDIIKPLPATGVIVLFFILFVLATVLLLRQKDII